MSHTEMLAVTFYSGHVVMVNGRRYAMERECRVVDVVRQVGRCSLCGGYAEKDDSYCPSCGAKVVAE